MNPPSGLDHMRAPSGLSTSMLPAGAATKARRRDGEPSLMAVRIPVVAPVSSVARGRHRARSCRPRPPGPPLVEARLAEGRRDPGADSINVMTVTDINRSSAGARSGAARPARLQRLEDLVQEATTGRWSGRRPAGSGVTAPAVTVRVWPRAPAVRWWRGGGPRRRPVGARRCGRRNSVRQTTVRRCARWPGSRRRMLPRASRRAYRG